MTETEIVLTTADVLDQVAVDWNNRTMYWISENPPRHPVRQTVNGLPVDDQETPERQLNILTNFTGSTIKTLVVDSING